MNSKKWCITVFCAALLCLLSLAAFNVFTDPFCAFGVSERYSFGETLNPRVAKVEYLKKYGDRYDAYIVGCSSTSSYPVETLNRYTGNKFYNMIVYGSDMRDTKEIVEYLLKEKTVKHIVVNLYLSNGQKYDYEDDPLTGSMHPDVDGSSKLAYLMKYAFCDPRYGIDRLENEKKDTYLAQSFDVFDEETGAYDKRKRDAEPISNLSTYLDAYPEFTNYTAAIYSLSVFRENTECLKAIKKACDEKNVELTVLLSPMYYKYFEYLPEEDLRAFFEAIAEAVDFWDFSISSVSYDARYFYDATHLRNDVGDMALARIFGDKSVYVPDDFGTLVTKENCKEYLDDLLSKEHEHRRDFSEYTAQIPVLMYHNVEPKTKNDMTVSPETFREHMQYLCEAGYTSVTLRQIENYIEKGKELPANPVLITFDDGYESNYTYAYPILKEYGMHGVIFAVGSTFGSDTYKETGKKIHPHFGEKELYEMERSGVIEVQSHTYDMHQEKEYEPKGKEIYSTVLPGKNETEAEYIERFSGDILKWQNTLQKKMTAFSYPNGVANTLSQVLLNQSGVKLTFCSEPHRNTLVKGLSQSGYSLGRFTITDDVSGEQLLYRIG